MLSECGYIHIICCLVPVVRKLQTAQTSGFVFGELRRFFSSSVLGSPFNTLHLNIDLSIGKREKTYT